MARTPQIIALCCMAALTACVDTKDTPDTGPEDYAAYCAACHGPTGKGNGDAASS